MIETLMEQLAPYCPHLAPPSHGSPCEIIWYANGHPGPVLAAKIERMRPLVVKALGGGVKKRNDSKGTRWIDDSQLPEMRDGGSLC